MLTKMVNGEHDLETLSRVSSIKEAQELAAELHDGLGQELAGISLLVSVLRRIPRAVPPRSPRPPREHCWPHRSSHSQLPPRRRGPRRIS